MYLLLAIFGSVLGLAVTAAAFYTAWLVAQHGKQQRATGSAQERAALTARLFMSWTVLDGAVVALFICGTLLLVADVLSVIRDRSGYPLYHYGYLLCGVTFSVMGMLFMLVRLALVLRTGSSASEAGQRAGRLTQGGAAKDEHGEP